MHAPEQHKCLLSQGFVQPRTAESTYPESPRMMTLSSTFLRAAMLKVGSLRT